MMILVIIVHEGDQASYHKSAPSRLTNECVPGKDSFYLIAPGIIVVAAKGVYASQS